MKVLVEGTEVLIDAEDAHLLHEHRWSLTRAASKYVRRQVRVDGKKGVVFLHRVVAGAKSHEIVDHINCNPLDNRRANLRVVSASANSRNKLKTAREKTSRFKGVARNKEAWRATIRTDQGVRYLGRFRDEVEAAFAYDYASLKYHGEFGRRNFLPLV